MQSLNSTWSIGNSAAYITAMLMLFSVSCHTLSSDSLQFFITVSVWTFYSLNDANSVEKKIRISLKATFLK